MEAENGLEALEVLQKNCDVDIVLSDINMPGMCGINLVKAIREKEAYNELAIAFFTTECCPVMKLKAKQLGVLAWIPKPIKPPLIINTLSKLVDKILSKKEALV